MTTLTTVPSDVPAPPLPTITVTAPSLPTHRLLATLWSPSSLTTSEELNRVLHLNERGLADASVRNHTKAWDLWRSFLHGREGSAATDPFLQTASDRDCGILMTLWVHWLRETEEKSAENIPGVISALKSNWITAGISRTFSDALAGDEGKRVKKAIAPTEDEVRVSLAKKRKNEKFPCPQHLIRACREEFFHDLTHQDESKWHDKAVIDKVGGYVAAILASETGQRGANWIHTRGSKTKAIKTIDVRFQVGEGNPDEDGNYPVIRELVGEAARKVLQGGGEKSACIDQLKRIRDVRLDFLTTKTKAVVSNIVIARRSEEEAQMLEDMGLWLCLSGTKDEDVFLTRRAKGKRGKSLNKRFVLQKEAADVVKIAVSAAGLPSDHFSVKSLRSALVSSMESGGAEKATIHGRTGHSKKSSVSRSHYDYFTSSSCGGRGLSIGPAAMAGSCVFDEEQLRAQIPPTSWNTVATTDSALESITDELTEPPLLNRRSRRVGKGKTRKPRK
jgi:hypothetical protein